MIPHIHPHMCETIHHENFYTLALLIITFRLTNCIELYYFTQIDQVLIRSFFDQYYTVTFVHPMG
ncbi:hypothetical protein [Salmonella phage SD-1_S14]|nr:hypothetical protein [Salmonella phage SD-2_S15]WPK19127.1 hypothetical protein [Salmonella phage SD-6_S16]WPK19800.1 hypothetical protein [Salmonella phage SD-1_S14]WPK20823.1 hypothetical protein [Salmonella phage SD-15_S21]